MNCSYCEDCGCRIYNGVCSNCHEELYIIENQSEFIDHALSDEFVVAANKSREKLKEDDSWEI